MYRLDFPRWARARGSGAIGGSVPRVPGRACQRRTDRGLRPPGQATARPGRQSAGGNLAVSQFEASVRADQPLGEVAGTYRGTASGYRLRRAPLAPMANGSISNRPTAGMSRGRLAVDPAAQYRMASARASVRSIARPAGRPDPAASRACTAASGRLTCGLGSRGGRDPSNTITDAIAAKAIGAVSLWTLRIAAHPYCRGHTRRDG